MPLRSLARTAWLGVSVACLAGCWEPAFVVGPQEPIGTVVGKLIDSEGRPAVGRKVQVMRAGTYTTQAINPIYLGIADIKADGAFEASAYDARVDVYLLAGDVGNVESAERIALARNLAVPRGGQVDAGTLQLPAGAEMP